MDIAELEEALRHINGHLISKKDMHYIYRVSVLVWNVVL